MRREEPPSDVDSPIDESELAPLIENAGKDVPGIRGKIPESERRAWAVAEVRAVRARRALDYANALAELGLTEGPDETEEGWFGFQVMYNHHDPTQFFHERGGVKNELACAGLARYFEALVERELRNDRDLPVVLGKRLPSAGMKIHFANQARHFRKLEGELRAAREQGVRDATKRTADAEAEQARKAEVDREARRAEARRIAGLHEEFPEEFVVEKEA